MRTQPLVVSTLAATALGLAILTVAPTVAHADVVPPGDPQTICNGKVLGDTCTLTEGGPGTCQTRDCNRTVSAGADGGTVIVRRSCVECVGASTGDSGADQGGTVKGGACSMTAGAGEHGVDVTASIGLLAMSIVLGTRRRRTAR